MPAAIDHLDVSDTHDGKAMALGKEVREAVEVGEDELRCECAGELDAAPPVLRHAATRAPYVLGQRLPRLHLAVLEHETETPDLLHVGQVLLEVGQRLPGRCHLDLVALRDQMLGDHPGAHRMPEALPDGAVEDSHRASESAT